jgi:Zn-finger protein
MKKKNHGAVWRACVICHFVHKKTKAAVTVVRGKHVCQSHANRAGNRTVGKM